jgi:predicted HicB family RNase H-like nuclease
MGDIGELRMLSNVLSYLDYRAEFGFDADADLLHGRVIGINAVVDFYGKDIGELKREFKSSIEDYLDYCRKLGVKPEKTWTGKLTLRPTEEQRRRYAVAAAIGHKSLNAWMVDILDRESLQAEGAAIAAG